MKSDDDDNDHDATNGIISLLDEVNESLNTKHTESQPEVSSELHFLETKHLGSTSFDLSPQYTLYGAQNAQI